ncbi:MAG: pyridoxal phosphate-dependent aminotransferase family protein [Deltaproteobacteria bacterium]|nr:pyridoxal phosphate-dependent aminotransferase family protein [Deltaproteobacteria bacterium]
MSWIDDKAHEGLARVREAREAGVYPFFRPFETGGIRTSVGGHAFVNFSSNDYLGLTTHPEVKEAAKRAIDTFACGLSSSRVQATTTAHVELEQRLAKYFGFEKALVTTTGYQAMVARSWRWPTATPRSSSTTSRTPASSTAPSSRRGARGARRR